jgi:hypothetical protein
VAQQQLLCFVVPLLVLACCVSVPSLQPILSLLLLLLLTRKVTLTPFIMAGIVLSGFLPPTGMVA